MILRKILNKSSFLCILVLFFLIIIFMIPSYAQDLEPKGVSISPVTFELNSDPGDVLTNQIKIYNPTEFPQTVKIKVEDFTPVGEEGQVILEEPDSENSTYSIASWTSVSPESFTLEPRDQQLVTFVINVPPNAEPGGHYGSIVAMVSGGTIGATGTSVETKRGALILLRISGKVTEEIIINTFSTKSFQEYGPIDFDLKFENTGNVHVRPAGFITITDMFGKQVAEIEIPQNNVIPGAIRTAGTTWEEKNLTGRYTATVVANFGATSKQTVISVTTFTVLPWKQALIICVIVLIILIIIIKSRKRITEALKVLFGKK